MVKGLKIIVVLASCFAFCATVDASGTITSEKNYLVPQSQMEALESRFRRLKTINLELQKDWLNQQKKLEALEEKSKNLESRLLIALDESKKQEESLMKLRESYQTYEKQTQKEIRKQKTEKLYWMIGCGLLGFVAISK